jgi:hypothetical protein
MAVLATGFRAVKFENVISLLIVALVIAFILMLLFVDTNVGGPGFP